MVDKNYAPINIKEITTQYGTMLRGNFNKEKMLAWINSIDDLKGYCNITIAERQSTGKYGETHSCWEDAWRPDPNYKKENKEITNASNEGDEELPF